MTARVYMRASRGNPQDLEAALEHARGRLDEGEPRIAHRRLRRQHGAFGVEPVERIGGREEVIAEEVRAMVLERRGHRLGKWTSASASARSSGAASAMPRADGLAISPLRWMLRTAGVAVEQVGAVFPSSESIRSQSKVTSDCGFCERSA
jgi:hypothetical protein